MCPWGVHTTPETRHLARQEKRHLVPKAEFLLSAFCVHFAFSRSLVEGRDRVFRLAISLLGRYQQEQTPRESLASEVITLVASAD
jgi:hypothetical protein